MDFRKIGFFLFCLFVYAGTWAQPGMELNQDGYNRFYYGSGKISSEGNLLGGKPEGYWKNYYENGMLKSEGNRVNFKLDGAWKFYSEEGKLLRELYYKEGKKSGIQKNYYLNGNLKSEENYDADSLNGLAKKYDENGKLQSQVCFQQGIEEGYARAFAPDGRIIKITIYKNGLVIREEEINKQDKSGNKQGMWKEFYDLSGLDVCQSDFVKNECPYKDNKKHGDYKEYALNGKVTNTARYKNGEIFVPQESEEDIVELKKYYYPDGKIKALGAYNKKGQAVGAVRQYDEQGNVTDTKIYRAGIMVRRGIMDEAGREQGPWKEFYETGELRAEGNYRDGKREGGWKFYYENGDTEQTGNYVSGKPEGAWKWYFAGGKLLREEFYSGGKENGPAKEYDELGTILAEGNYAEGKKNGMWKFNNGGYRAEGKYVDDAEEGEWKQFYDNGQLAFEGNYIDGNENGLHKYYYENGRQKEERHYKLGEKDGMWKLYSFEGMLLLTTYYADGKELKVDGKNLPQLPAVKDKE